MRITVTRFTLTKRHALTISRGTYAGSENLLLEIEHEGIVGCGEMAPTTGGDAPETVETALQTLHRVPGVERRTDGSLRFTLAQTPFDMQTLEEFVEAEHWGYALRAALDMALYDWQGKSLGIPVWKMLGLEPSRIVPTSVTIGINAPEIVRELVPEILNRTHAQALKVKLGSPEGIEADRAMFTAVQEAASAFPIAWRVDANGGWDVEEARTMLRWLAERNVAYVEQPLLRGREKDYTAIHHDSPLPIFADESIYFARDIPALAPHIDGVNLKLMKCGGLREALRIIHTARAHNLLVMMGCMSESSLAITAAAHISPLADYLDLDSHLNLLPDPFTGAGWQDGRVVPGDGAGLGVSVSEHSTL